MSVARRSISKRLASTWNPDEGSWVYRYRSILAVFAVALGLRIVAALLMANTYDADEFVYLALGRALAHGSMPYRDFAFFHPPGILTVIAALDPLTRIWWPTARIFDLILDSFTAVVVWKIADVLYGRRGALAAGLLYAANPLIIVSAVRLDQEVPMTALCLLGLAIILTRESHKAAAIAGACLAAAFWIKYPMLILLPAYVLAARGRNRAVLAGFLTTCALLFAPFLPSVSPMVRDTVAWQLNHRVIMPLDMRMSAALIFWLLASPLALLALWRRVKPVWLAYAFVAWGAFIAIRPALYPHYFVPAAAFGTILGAGVIVQLRPATKSVRRLIFWAAPAAFVLTGLSLWRGPQPVFESRFSDVAPVVALLEREVPPGGAVLGNSPEYGYLAGRAMVGHYFWDDHDLVSARYLENQLPAGSAAVLKPAWMAATHPIGLLPYLDTHGERTRLHGASVWILTPDVEAEAVRDRPRRGGS